MLCLSVFLSASDRMHCRLVCFTLHNIVIHECRAFSHYFTSTGGILNDIAVP